jgi:hypothetical protein
MHTTNEPKVKEPRAKRVRNRPVIDRKPLRNLLRQFRLDAHNVDPLRNIRPSSFILDNNGIVALTKVHPNRMEGPRRVIETLGETPEWAEEWSQAVFNVIHEYDNPAVMTSLEDDDGDNFDASFNLEGRDLGSGVESDAEADVRMRPKRRTEGPVISSVKRRRKDVSVDLPVEDTSNLRRSSRAAIATRRYIGL